MLAAGTVGVAVAVLPAGGATSVVVGGSSWSQLQSDALTAAANYLGVGSLDATAPLTPVATSTIPGITVTVQQRTLVAADSSSTIVLGLSYLGDEQLVVDVMDATAGFQGATLVLRPGSDSVTGTYALPGATSATSSVRHGRRPHGGIALDSFTGAHSTLVGTGCTALPQHPTAITSTFGPLIKGVGVISCVLTESLAIIVGLYRGVFTHVGTTSGTTISSSYVTQGAYAQCIHISGTHNFRTSQLWSVNGNFQGGATSSEAALHCT